MKSLKFKIRNYSALSKNRSHRFGNGRMYLTKQAKRIREEIAWIIKGNEGGWRKDKLTISYKVFWGKRQGDAQNFVDSIFDAVEMGTGINDKWYEIGSVTWEKGSDDPRIEIEISQAEAS